INNINDKTENIISCSYSPWYSSNYPDENGQCPKVSNTFLVKTPGFIKQLPIEDVIVTLELEQVQPLDLSVELISPSGTRSRLAYSHDSNTFSSSGSDLKWDFLSNAFWGENPQGTWRVEIYSKAGNIRYPGKINRVKLSLRTGKLL
ncbi:MAG: proprotein convertase P-domain-containing protein, partial [Gammaproteobacteria bacterium]|nr:proprotein convertase P-domain-containing protein [Gammaproteobacteria bacterium]